MKPRIFPILISLAMAITVIVISSDQVAGLVPQSSAVNDLKSLNLTQAVDPYSNQVEAGLNYFRRLAQQQLPLVENLKVALKTGNIKVAEFAYVEARPPYEQIEVFAPSFEQEDSDIDARPYAFDEGEQSSDFKGFHRIERLIFRDRNPAAAVPYAEELVDSIRSLIGKLNDSSNFSAALNFDGMIALATEVPAKKISGEEETWSDQSVLIFRENWDGIYSQYKPFASLLNSAITTQVDAAYQACRNSIAPFVTEGVAAAAPYSSLGTQERRAIVKASYQLRDALIMARDALNLG